MKLYFWKSKFSHREINLKMSSVKWRLFCLGLDVFNINKTCLVLGWVLYLRVNSFPLLPTCVSNSPETINANNGITFMTQHMSLLWRHNECDDVSNNQPHDCLLNRSFRCRSKKTSKLRVTGLCAGNSPVTGEFPAQMARNAENISIWWHRHVNYHHEFYELFVVIWWYGNAIPWCALLGYWPAMGITKNVFDSHSTGAWEKLIINQYVYS